MAEKSFPQVLNLIVAYESKFGIGNKNKLPWPRLATDMQHLKDRTTKTTDPNKRNVLIYGKKTWYCIPTPAREKIYGHCFQVVFSRGGPVEGAELTCESLEAAMSVISSPEHKNQFESIWVMGGTFAYTQALTSSYPLKLYATVLGVSFECDTFFPQLTWSEWEETTHPDIPGDPITEKDISYQFKIYSRPGKD